MKFVADLHLHSKYSRAVSQEMVLSKMANWARIKGISVVATGDFCHPFWFEQLKNELEDAGNGLFKLKQTANSLEQTAVNGEQSAVSDVYFLLSCEVSSIYSQGAKVRRIHNLFFFPSLASVERFNGELLKRGANLRADGRPIVGITSRDLARLALDCDEKALVIPAHAWTPWFSVFGSFSGFDSIEECFGDMSKYIYGIETGLSSDPAMNWQIEDLDNRAILSFSDAHSLGKMGREATVFEAEEISYDAIYQAIVGSEFTLRSPRQFGKSSNASAPAELGVRSPSATLGKTSPHAETPGAIAGPVSRFPPAYAKASAGKPASESSAAVPLEVKRSGVGSLSTPAIRKNLPNYLSTQLPIYPKIAFTIEFYPEEGKYHYNGHRDCNFSQSPEETAKNGEICPVCKKHLTIGVIHRVEELKTRNPNFEIRDLNGVRWVYPKENGRPPYVSLVPLNEILAEAIGAAVGTKKVVDQYMSLVNGCGSEFNILLKSTLDDIKRIAPHKVAEAINKVRQRDIVVEPGYDGKFGEVKIWSEQKSERQSEVQEEAQLNLFV